MEVHLGTMAENIVTMAVFYLLFLFLKSSTVFLGYWIGRESGRNGFISAISLTAMGEFAFIISKEALDFGAVDESFYTSVIGAALISMIVMPIANRYSGRLWDGAETRCPKPVLDLSAKITGYRNKMYYNFSSASKSSRRLYKRGMASGYIDLLAIFLIELAFYIGAPILSPILFDIFGGSIWLWDFVLLVINFIVLIPPISYLVSNIKSLEKLIIRASRNSAKKSGGGDLVKTGDIYEKMLNMNNLIAILTIDLAIIAVVPNPLGLAEHIMLLAIAVAVAIAVYLRMTGKHSASEGSDDGGGNGPGEDVDYGIRDTGGR
jgi:CPA2 family monovalent cation:H+ antiporter-2